MILARQPAVYIDLVRALSSVSSTAVLDGADDITILDKETLVHLCFFLGGQQDHSHIDEAWYQHDGPLRCKANMILALSDSVDSR